MFIGTILILMAWFVNMPLWLSIITTIVGGLKIIASLVEFGIKLKSDN